MINSDLPAIGIQAYNEVKFVLRTLDSCVKQAKKVVVFDNASTDNTEEVCI